MATCEFVFDVASPYSYLASTQLKALRERTGCELRLHPVALGGIFKSTGRAELPPPPQLRWMTHDLARWAKKYGVPFRFPSAFPTRTLLAQRTIVAAAGEDARQAAMHALFRAYWGEGWDVGEAEVVRTALDGARLDGAALIARAGEQPIKDELRANTDAAIERGVFGVPTFFVGQELFWGNDRLEFVEAALRTARRG